MAETVSSRPQIGARLIVVSYRRRNDRPGHAHRGLRRRSSPHHPGPRSGSDAEWLWGWHAVAAALANPARGPALRLLATPERARELATLPCPPERAEILSADAIAAQLPPGAAHQGLALSVPPLAPVKVDDLAQPAQGVLALLDQVTDPQNIGQVFRCAAAFGARGIILQDRHAPGLGGTLAKAAAGAIDVVPHARVTNLSRTLERLDSIGWRTIGLDGGGDEDLEAALDGAPVALVLGSEGEGLRRLVREHCHVLARIPMPGGFESLNVAAAAAVALYAASRTQARRTP
jgi:23S rRNA (guanosine2251-2'-O)-methyltransferase